MKSKKRHKNKCLPFEADTIQFNYATIINKMRRQQKYNTESVYRTNVQRMTPRRNPTIKVKDK